MGALTTKIYRLDRIEVQVAQQCISRDGEIVYLRAKTFQVLLYLLQHRDRLVSKQELFEALWGDTAVSDGSLVQCVIDLRKALGDDSRSPRYIKTIPKVGYRFIGPAEEVVGNASTEEVACTSPTDAVPVSVEIESYTRYDVEYEESAEVEPKLLAPPSSRLRWVTVALAGILVLVGVQAVLSSFPMGLAPRGALPRIEGRRPVAVMYFENQSGTPELDWLREGLADILITDLSRSPSLTVLSREELHHLLDRRRKPSGPLSLDDALAVAKASRADILATGTFAKFGDRVRINVQLHDGHTGHLLTAESVTGERAGHLLADIDELSHKLARDLGAANPPGGNAPVSTSNLEAFRYYSLAVEKAQAYHTQDAVALLEKAIALDPQFAMAQARIGYAYAVTWIEGKKGKPYLERAFALSSRLTELDRMYISAWYAIANYDYPAAIDRYRELVAAYPRESEAYVRLGHLLRGEERWDEAIAALQQGLRVDPDGKDLYNAIGAIYSQQGRHEEAIAMERKYISLAPAEANAHDSLALTYEWAGRMQEAEGEYLQAIELDPAFDIPRLHLGTLHFRMGRYREALSGLQRQFALAPSPLQRATVTDNLSEVLWRSGETARAEKELERAIGQVEWHPFGPMRLALWRKDLPAALSVSKKLARPPDWTHRGARPPYLRRELYLRGQLALLQGQNEQALNLFREALRHWTGWADFDPLEDCLADAYFQLGRWAEAIAEYQRILKLFPGRAMARYHLASAYERSGRTQLARAEFVRFLDFWKTADPDIKEVRTARAFVDRKQR